MIVKRTFTIGSLALGAAVLIGACSGTGSTATSAPATAAPSASPSASDMPSAMPSASPSGGAMTAPFGAACASVPTSGAGSFEGMAGDPVATAASNNPALSTLVTAVTAAGLVDTLNTTADITVFAPADSAFAAMDKATLDSALADPKGLLTTVLTYHVVPGRLSPDQLAGTHTTLQGGTLEVTGADEAFTVNGAANVVCGNVQTDNATVYIIDQVLLPTS
jgi:uncharacterized surface protein with fasciclin (FAS1) repeats